MDLWVFGYGSLIFDPGMAVAESVRARVTGYRRRFCMWSIHHRGSEAEPGLVLALEEAAGATCDGIAFRAAEPEAALAALRERELISSAYLEVTVPLRAADGRDLRALAYVIDPAHRQYAADLTLEEQARVIATAHGGRGPNSDYLFRANAALHDHAIADPDLDRLERMVRRMGDTPDRPPAPGL